MNVDLSIPESEAIELYRQLHQDEGDDVFRETYRQLQLHFFKTLTVEEVTTLLEDRR